MSQAATAPTSGSIDDLPFGPQDEPEDIFAILNSDPFAPAEPEPKAIPADPPAGPSQQPAAVEPAAPAAPTPDPVSTALERQTAILEQMAQNQQPVPQPQQPPAQDPRIALMQQYTLQVPPAVLQGLQSEDPAVVTQALQVMMAAPALAVHQRMEQLMTERLAQFEQQFTAKLQQTQTVAAKQAEMQKDFYGRYTGLNVPALRPVVVQAAQQLLASDPKWRNAQGYTPEFGDALAAHIAATVPQLATLVQRQAPAAPTPTPQPARQFNPGARPAQPSNEPDILSQLGIG